MQETVIEVKNLSKQYRLGTVGTGTLAHDLNRWWYRMRGKEDPYLKVGEINDRSQKGSSDYVWALRDINFELKKGEVLGIIGRNGAGKSTLLKILSRVTQPTTGSIKMKGRIASLLEVGTGFHPELTGRENVFLNGAIMGMSKSEIAAKFAEIVNFSGVERYIDTPVKRYSSGMYVRLAFAVAAHLDPDILIVDEVLAVGDTEFQKKCLGKMKDVSGEGRTVLFVSHNLQAIRNLSERSILLSNGQIICDAETEKTLNVYSNLLREKIIDDRTDVGNSANRRGEGAIRFTKVDVQDIHGNRTFNFEMGDTIKFVMTYKVFKDMEGIAVYIGVNSGLTRERITSVRYLLASDLISSGSTGSVVIDVTNICLRPGEYPLLFHLCDAATREAYQDVLDDVTSPLIITAGNKMKMNHYNFDVTRPSGFISITSDLVLNELLQ